jgi:hypothetical protein
LACEEIDGDRLAAPMEPEKDRAAGGFKGLGFMRSHLRSWRRPTVSMKGQ